MKDSYKKPSPEYLNNKAIFSKNLLKTYSQEFECEDFQICNMV